MDIPEQDKQAFIEAARRRMQPKEGGAAFGVYPSSGKRPEKLNVSRDVNMPAQAGRGWVAGTLGLLGDFESIGRAGINFAFGPGGVNVDETPVLPTSEFYQEWLPGRDERPAAKFASGLGALAGGAGSTKLAGAAVKGAKATGKALGPKAAEMAESYLKKSGLAPELIAYHGTPHRFAPEEGAPLGKFRSEKIGTGEGAQAYGHGLYLAESPEVAKSYTASTGKVIAELDGVPISSIPNKSGIVDWLDSYGSIANTRAALAGRKPELAKELDDLVKSGRLTEGNLYTVDIPDEKIAQMLDWDKPLSQQSKNVRDAIKKANPGLFQRGRYSDRLSSASAIQSRYPGKVISDLFEQANASAPAQRYGKPADDMYGIDYWALALRVSEGNPAKASQFMRDAGITGIRYLDAGSRDGGAGTRNFVIFPGEEESVKIIDRKAEGGLVQDTDAIAAKLTGMDKDKALTHALRMANAKQEAHMAAGGLAKLLKGAKKAEDVAKPAQIGNYQALPLDLPRAPNLPPQELTKTAERIARQQMGEHVRKAPNKAESLAGRSMKEVERLKNLDIQIQRTKDLPTPSVVPEELGQVRIALPGDISVADQILMSVNDLPIGAPQEGGPMYGLGKMNLKDPRFWASNEQPAQIFQNKVTDLANLYETPEILAQHLAMAHDAMNFAQHFADASLRAMQQMPVHPESAREFNKIIREGYEKINPRTKERVRIGFPDFPGVENYDEAYKALKANPEMRKWFNNRMKVEKITEPLGLPSGKEIEYAIMEPELRNMEHSLTGLSVGRMKPGASLIPGSEHATYSHDIAGQALGRTKELTPLELAFPDASAYIRQTQRPQDFTGTIQKVFPHQVVDDQYINQLGEYYNRLKQIRGYKKGGLVKKSGLSVLNKAII